MHGFAVNLAISISMMAVGQVLAGPLKNPPFFYSQPGELQFSCAVMLNKQEEALARKLDKGSVDERCAAARELWTGHSGRHAQRVVELTLASAPESQSLSALKRFVDDSLKPEAILREIRDGDNSWGLWLACLKPHESLVPELLVELNKKKLNRSAVILALGKSGDKRALQPLLELLKDPDHRLPGDAAQALGYLAFPEVEQELVDALSTDNPWLKVKACSALGKVGSRRALPALQRIANDQRYTGALSVRSGAEAAIQAIVKRNPEVESPNLR